MPVAAVRVAVHTGWAFRPNRGDQALGQPIDPRSGVEGVDRASKTRGRAPVGSVSQAVLRANHEFRISTGWRVQIFRHFEYSATLIPALERGTMLLE